LSCFDDLQNCNGFPAFLLGQAPLPISLTDTYLSVPQNCVENFSKQVHSVES